MEDRRILHEDGMLIIALAIDSRSNTLLDNPIIYNRGVVQKHNEKALLECQALITSAVKEKLGSKTNFSELKTIVKDVASKFVYTRTKRYPMIIPIIMSKN